MWFAPEYCKAFWHYDRMNLNIPNVAMFSNDRPSKKKYEKNSSRPFCIATPRLCKCLPAQAISRIALTNGD
jgi:hypothetical protein